MNRIIFTILTLTLIALQSSAQNSNMDSLWQKRRVLLGAGLFAGNNYVLGLPKAADHNTGGHFGGGIKLGYKLLKKFLICAEARYIQSNQVINLNLGYDPDFLLTSTSTLQLPVVLTYKITNRKQLPIIDFGLGLAYQMNNNETHYRIAIPKYSGMLNSASKRENLSTKSDWFLLIRVVKQIIRNKEQNVKCDVFFEYQHGLSTHKFVSLLNDDEAQDKFLHYFSFSQSFFRVGVNFNFNL